MSARRRPGGEPEADSQKDRGDRAQPVAADSEAVTELLSPKAGVGDETTRDDAVAQLGEDPTLPTPPLVAPSPSSNSSGAVTVDSGQIEVLVAEAGYELPSRFEVKALLGRGGMGLVVAATDQVLERDVAVKLLPASVRDDPDMWRRFLNEARAAAALRHPGIVTIHDVDPERGFMVMEIVAGESLRDRIKRAGALPPGEVRRLALAMLDALSAAHDVGVVHRDVKPANILIAESSGGYKLADFGIAAFGGAGEAPVPGVRIGTPAYGSPEQLAGEGADARSDVYSLGVTLYEALTGRRLRQRPSDVGEVLFRRNERDEPSVDAEQELLRVCDDAKLTRAILRALATDPQERFATAAAFAAALKPDPIDADRLEASHSPGDRPSRWTSGQIGVRAVVLGGAVLMTVAAAAWWWAARDRPTTIPGSATPGVTDTPGPVALLPFDDRTGEPMLDFARGGLPHLLGMELRRSEIKTVGYYRLLEHVESPDAPDNAWMEAAGRLGARTVVGGLLEPDEHGVHVVVVARGLDGAELARLERVVAVEEVPRAVRLLAPGLAALLTGRDVAKRDAIPLAFDAERELHLGIAALEQHDLLVAGEHLESALRAHPGLGEALYYQAVLSWWRSSAPATTMDAIERALATDLSAVERGFLQGLTLLVRLEYPQAIEHFQRLSERYPEERDVLYGLAEALYHGGRPDEGIATYRRVVELSPRFRLGLFHAIAYYIARGDAMGRAWAMARADTYAAPRNAAWAPKGLFAEGDYAGAIALIHRLSDTRPEVAPYLSDALMAAYAVTDQLPLTEARVELAVEGNEVHGARMKIAMLLARGAGEEALRRWRELAEVYVASEPAGRARMRELMELLILELPAASAARAAELGRVFRAALDSSVDGRLDPAILATLLAGAAGDEASIRAARDSAFPEVAAIAAALTAEGEGRWADAAEAWRRAAAVTSDGRFLVLEHHRLAGARRAMEDYAGVVAACGEVLTPRVFQWTWAATAGSCLLWTAEAEAARAHPGAARTAYERLLRLRTADADADPLVAAARSGMAALPDVE